MNVLHASERLNNFAKTLSTKHKFLKKYQALILNYFYSSEFKNKNMLLLWLAVGRGKTLLSLSCAIAGLDSGQFKRIIILSPKAIQDEFHKNLFLYFYFGNDKNKAKAQSLYDKYVSSFMFIPYNAWNSFDQFSDIDKLEHSLFIIDEAHLFMKSIIKTNLLPEEYLRKSKDLQNKGNAKRIYDIIKKLKNKKVLCLTGTPSAKTPYETIPIFNLAYDKDLFTEDYNEFNEKFIDFENEKILHQDELLKKLDGLIAYVPPMTSKDVGQVKASPLKIVEVEMSQPQYKQYLIDWEKEKNELGFTNKRNMYGLLFGAKSSFHAKTFGDCVYWNEELKNTEDEDRLQCSKLKIDKEHAPKIIKMFADAEKVKGSCCFYFHFTSIYGSAAMEAYLEQNGYRKPFPREDVFETKEKRYVVFSGDIQDKTRDNWKHLFNDRRNKYGEYIKYIILSPSGIVGISLKNVRYLGIGSVEFNYSNIRQLLGRCNRLNSHADLPPEDRTLSNNIYIMLKNEEYYKKHKRQVEEISDRTTFGYDKPCPTIERIIYNDSLKDDVINEEFKNKILIKASITEKLLDKILD